MNSYDLPESLTIDGKKYRIRTDYRDIINIMVALTDPDLDNEAKAYVFFMALFIDPVPPSLQEEAMKAGFDFINGGIPADNTPPVRLMDWEQDAPLVVSAVNKVAGCEIRAKEHLHWWTFLGYYMEIGESQFSTVISIRSKLKHKKKLETYEKEYYRENKSVVDLKDKISSDELDELEKLIGW